MSQSASQALARKWRPHDFDTLVGQSHVVKALSHALDTQRLHHAYLFTGTRGVGKTTIARILAKAVNCELGVSKTPCGKCGACVEISQGRFTDLLEVDAATNTRVDEMRQLLENAMYAPTAGRYKVYVIDEVHMLSTSAFNAMLKTLEEPPGHVLFILATTDPQKIPATVLSRCLQFGLRQLTPDQIADHLAHILENESIASQPGALRIIAKAARGSLRDALSLTDQAIAYSAGVVSEESVRAMLGTVDQQLVIDILQALAVSDGVALNQITRQLMEASAPFGSILSELAAASYRLSVAALAGGFDEQDPDDMALASMANQLNPEALQLIYQIATHARSELHLAPDDGIGFGMALLRMLAFKPGGGGVISQSPISGGAAPGNTQQGVSTQSSPSVSANSTVATPPSLPAEKAPSPSASVARPQPPSPQRPHGDGPAAMTNPATNSRGPSDAARAALAAAKAVMQRGISSGKQVAGARQSTETGALNSDEAKAERLEPVPARVEIQPPQPEAGKPSSVATKPSVQAPPLTDSEPPPWVSESIDEAQPAFVPQTATQPKPHVESMTVAQWSVLSEKLPASGLTRQALVQTELLSMDVTEHGLRIRLRTPLKRYAEPSVAERLQELLADHFAAKVQVEFEVGEVQHTAHLQHSELRKQAFDDARQSIESDPFVQALRKEMGAEVLDGSQRPLHSQGPADV